MNKLLNHYRYKYPSQRHRGVALVIGLIMLTMVTLLAITSMQSTTLQELMSSNLKDQMTAFEAAETAIRSAEQFLESDALNLGAFDDDYSDGLIKFTYDDVWGQIDWATESEQIADIPGVTSAPRYVIQYIGPVIPDVGNQLNVENAYGQSSATDTLVEMFKITARGTGGSDSTVVVLESMYGVVN
ncbi:MAG: PilX N-terminal domain-containing pilus assembly protein [Pseudomonadota bacterium]